MTIDRPVVRLVPGAGLVAREGDLLLVCESAPADVADKLLTAVQEVARQGGNGRLAVRRVAEVLGRSMAEEPVACAIAGPVGDGAAVLVSGAASAQVTGPDGEVTLSGRSSLTWTDRLVPGPVSGIVLRLDAAGTSAPDPRLRLEGGVVSGAGLHLGPSAPLPAAEQTPPRQPGWADAEWRIAAPAEAHPATLPSVQLPLPGPEAAVPLMPPPEPARVQASLRAAWWPEPARVQASLRATMLDEAQSEPFESVLLLPQPDQAPPVMPPAEPAPPEPDARPIVQGADCKNGHFNDPRVHYCGICGIAMAQLTLVLHQGPRPSLGLLILDDGSALSLETSYLLGRDPENTAEVTSGMARPLRLTDAENSISRRHAQIVLDQWDVLIIDMGTVNGTYVQGPDEPASRKIPPNQPIMIHPGAVVRVGRSRTFRYESNRRR